MYLNRDNSRLNKQDIFSNILQLKDTMNDKIVDFDLPENHIRITGNYLDLVGLLEGGGGWIILFK